VNTQDNTVIAFPEPQGFATAEPQGFAATDRQGLAAAGPLGFTTEDILWALGIWSVILSLSPVVVFYMLMVA